MTLHHSVERVRARVQEYVIRAGLAVFTNDGFHLGDVGHLHRSGAHFMLHSEQLGDVWVDRSLVAMVGENYLLLCRTARQVREACVASAASG